MHHEIDGFSTKWSQLTTQLYDSLVRLAILWSPMGFREGNYCRGTFVFYWNDIYSFFKEILSNGFSTNFWGHHKLGLQPMTSTYLCATMWQKCHGTHPLRISPVFLPTSRVSDKHNTIRPEASNTRRDTLRSVDSGRLRVELFESLSACFLS